MSSSSRSSGSHPVNRIGIVIFIKMKRMGPAILSLVLIRAGKRNRNVMNADVKNVKIGMRVDMGSGMKDLKMNPMTIRRRRIVQLLSGMSIWGESTLN